MDSLLRAHVRSAISAGAPVDIVKICESIYDAPAHTMADLRRRSRKRTGDAFEEFCKMYLTSVASMAEVWLLEEVPQEVLDELKMSRRDMGIDLIARDRGGNYHAIQAKFRRRKSKRVGLPWRELSTFYALCARTGPFAKHVVFTTADYVRRAGTSSTPQDRTIAIGTLRGITHFQWLAMLGEEEPPPPPPAKKTDEAVAAAEDELLSREELRARRVRYFALNLPRSERTEAPASAR